MNTLEKGRTTQAAYLRLTSGNTETSVAEFMKLPRINRLRFSLAVLLELQEEDTAHQYNYTDMIQATEQRIKELTRQ